MKKYIIFLVAFLALNSLYAQSNIAHLNSQEVMAAMPSYNRAVQDLAIFQDELVKELEDMKKDFQKELVIYQEMMAEGKSATLIQFQEQKLSKKEVAIQERQQAMQAEVEAYSRELNYPIITNIEKAVKIVADRNRYDYVFDVSTLMISNGPDVTKEVITEVLLLENAPPPQEEIREVSRP